MAQMFAAMEAGGSAYVGEHTCRRVVAGDVEGVRERLVYALEKLDYSVISEQSPIQAKRPARKNIISADFLEYACKLNVALRPNSAASTLVTFDYTVTHSGLMTKGDRKTLEREADAIIALAASRPASSVCAACGTENTGDSRFCRLCGTPNVTGEPAEVEVMRLTAGARASLQEIYVGLLISLITFVLFLPLILFAGPKGVKAGLVFLAIGQLVGIPMLMYGMSRLHRTLNPKEERRAALPLAVPPTPLPTAHASALPPARVSVTEGTTELLSAERREPVGVPLRRKSGETDPLG